MRNEYDLDVDAILAIEAQAAPPAATPEQPRTDEPWEPIYGALRLDGDEDMPEGQARAIAMDLANGGWRLIHVNALRMVLGMIEPMEREEWGRPGRRTWGDIDEAWAMLLDVERGLTEAQAAPPDALREALDRLATASEMARRYLVGTTPCFCGRSPHEGFCGNALHAIGIARAALAAPATLPAIDTRIVWKRDHGMVLVHSTGDEEPQSLEIPAWAVRTIFDVAGKDPEEEARKVSAFINAHTGLDVERLARALHATDNPNGSFVVESGPFTPNGQSSSLRACRWQDHIAAADSLLAAYAATNPILTYTDPAGGPDWEPRSDER